MGVLNTMSKTDKTVRWFQVAFDHDRLADGGLPPAHLIGISVQRPVMIAGQVHTPPERIELKAVPSTRLFQTTDPVVAAALAQLSTLIEIDPPTPQQLKQHKQQITTPASAGKEK